MKKLQTFDSIYFWGKSHFEEDNTQNYLVFQPMYRYFKRGGNANNHILSWKSKGLPDEGTNNFLDPSLDYLDHKIRVKFSGSCLKQDKLTYTHGKIVNIYTVYEISKNYNIRGYSTLENCLFGADSFTWNADIDKYKQAGYGIWFDRHGFFSEPVVKLAEI